VRRTVQVTTRKNASEPFFLGEVRGGIKGTHKYRILYLCFKTGNKFTLLYYWKDAIKLNSNLLNIFVRKAKEQLYFRRHFIGIVTT
jgi:hypothetical protein